jgi:hypothetical protein
MTEFMLIIIVVVIAVIFLTSIFRTPDHYTALNTLNVDLVDYINLCEDRDFDGLVDLYYRRYTQEEKLLWVRLARHIDNGVLKLKIWKWDVDLIQRWRLTGKFPFLVLETVSAILDVEASRKIDGGWCSVIEKRKWEVKKLTNCSALSALEELLKLRAAYRILRQTIM